MGSDRDSRHDAFHIAAVVKKRGEACPRLLVHPVAFVENANPAANHGADQRRGMVGDLARLGENGCDDEVFGTCVGGTLIDVKRLLA